MNKKISTADRIITVSRHLFNKKGYAATSLTEIADEVGISQGNLSYHFPTKKDLVARLQENVHIQTQARQAALVPGPIADDYVEHLLFATTLMWENRFIFRDRVQYADEGMSAPARGMEKDFEELFRLVRRLEKAGMFRQDLGVDLETLTRSIWIVSRYWMDHLREYEGRDEITWADQERGIEHHFAVLFPCLLSSARRDLTEALVRLSSERRAKAT